MLHAQFINNRDKPNTLRIQSSDTDVALLLLHFSPQFKFCGKLLLEIGVDDKKAHV